MGLLMGPAATCPSPQPRPATRGVFVTPKRCLRNAATTASSATAAGGGGALAAAAEVLRQRLFAGVQAEVQVGDLQGFGAWEAHGAER